MRHLGIQNSCNSEGNVTSNWNHDTFVDMFHFTNNALSVLLARVTPATLEQNPPLKLVFDVVEIESEQVIMYSTPAVIAGLAIAAIPLYWLTMKRLRTSDDTVVLERNTTVPVL